MMVFYSMRKNWEDAKLDEGIQEIVRVNFVPEFGSDADRELFFSFL